MIILRQMTHHLGHVIEDIPDCDFLFRVKKLQASYPIGCTLNRLNKLPALRGVGVFSIPYFSAITVSYRLIAVGPCVLRESPNLYFCEYAAGKTGDDVHGPISAMRMLPHIGYLVLGEQRGNGLNQIILLLAASYWR